MRLITVVFASILALSVAAAPKTYSGLFQVEKSTVRSGYEVIYYPANMHPDESLRYPGAPPPSHARPTWKPVREKTSGNWVALSLPSNVIYGPFKSERAAELFCRQTTVAKPCTTVPLHKPTYD